MRWHNKYLQKKYFSTGLFYNCFAAINKGLYWVKFITANGSEVNKAIIIKAITVAIKNFSNLARSH